MATKKDPGIAGLITQAVSTDPIANAKVEIYDAKGKKLTTRYADEDSWYQWQYKYTGKPTTFTVKVPDYNLQQSVTLKSNGFIVVNFSVP